MLLWSISYIYEFLRVVDRLIRIYNNVYITRLGWEGTHFVIIGVMFDILYIQPLGLFVSHFVFDLINMILKRT